MVFRLTAPAPGSTTWTFAALHNFANSGTELNNGYKPAALALDATGKISANPLYGLTFSGGAGNGGVAFRLP